MTPEQIVFGNDQLLHNILGHVAETCQTPHVTKFRAVCKRWRKACFKVLQKTPSFPRLLPILEVSDTQNFLRQVSPDCFLPLELVIRNDAIFNSRGAYLLNNYSQNIIKIHVDSNKTALLSTFQLSQSFNMSNLRELSVYCAQVLSTPARNCSASFHQLISRIYSTAVNLNAITIECKCSTWEMTPEDNQNVELNCSLIDLTTNSSLVHLLPNLTKLTIRTAAFRKRLDDSATHAEGDLENCAKKMSLAQFHNQISLGVFQFRKNLKSLSLAFNLFPSTRRQRSERQESLKIGRFVCLEELSTTTFIRPRSWSGSLNLSLASFLPNLKKLNLNEYPIGWQKQVLKTPSAFENIVELTINTLPDPRPVMNPGPGAVAVNPVPVAVAVNPRPGQLAVNPMPGVVAVNPRPDPVAANPRRGRSSTARKSTGGVRRINGRYVDIQRVRQVMNPRERQVVNPRMGQVLNPRMGQVLNPRMGQVLNPRMGQVLNPRMGQVLNPRMGQALNPRMGQVLNPRMGQVRNPRMPQVVNPRMVPVFTPEIHEAVLKRVIRKFPNLKMLGWECVSWRDANATVPILFENMTGLTRLKLTLPGNSSPVKLLTTVDESEIPRNENAWSNFLRGKMKNNISILNLKDLEEIELSRRRLNKTEVKFLFHSAFHRMTKLSKISFNYDGTSEDFLDASHVFSAVENIRQKRVTFSRIRRG